MFLNAQSLRAEDIQERMSLVSEYSSKTCSSQCEKRVSELYKSMYNLSALTFPFKSFQKYSLIEKGQLRAGVRLFPEFGYDDNMCVSFKSDDNLCLCFADMINCLDRVGDNRVSDNRAIYTQEQYDLDWCTELAADVTSNERSLYRHESMLYNRQNEKTKEIIANNIQLLNSNPLFSQCGCDGIYLCRLPLGNKIGYYYYEKSEYIVPKGYNNVFKLIIIKYGNYRMTFYLFISDAGVPKVLDYVKAITESFQYE